MGLKEKIKELLSEAELYKTQGLLNEAKDRYYKVRDLIQSNDKIANAESLLESMNKKIKSLEKLHTKVTEAPSTPEMSKKAQDLIKDLFTFSKETDEATVALEGAISLAKFGQYKRAIEEFQKLFTNEKLRVSAAKNMIKCYHEFVSLDKAVEEFLRWKAMKTFPGAQTEKIQVFLEGVIQKAGKSYDLDTLPDVSEEAVQFDEVEDEVTEDEETADIDDILDISSVGITLDKGPTKGTEVELDVSFQTGNIISVIISKSEKDLLDNLKVGEKLDNVNFYSPIAIFRGAGIISGSTRIDSGPKEGDFCLDIKVTSI